MIMKSRYFYGTVILLMLITLVACHRKHRGGEVKPNVSCSHTKTVKFNQEDVFDFLSLDTSSYYLGKIGQTRCMVKMDTLFPLGMHGRYFRIDSSDWTFPVSFYIGYEDGAYCFRSGETDCQLKFELNLSPVRISGTFGFRLSSNTTSGTFFWKNILYPFSRLIPPH